MALQPGTRLGPYEVLAAIGAGGMGEVYKARDTRLERAVALKVIHPSAAASPEMRERFEREARAISALDHPHICMLYDVCRESPAGTGSEEAVSFLVMQYLEGETLADRLARAGRPLSDPTKPSSGAESALATISRGPIPFDTALKYAAEIAQALDAAHRHGIVHRDLKPGNVMLTKAGTKLLDFGLAKLAANDIGFGGSGDRTRTSPFAQGAPLTSQGAILGTLQYMSPEQLEGRDVDSRSDIHAFGALLFEMLSGQRAFAGQSQAGIIAAIIGSDPPALKTLADARTSLPVVAHRALDRLLAKCLAKNPDDRWQSAADLAAELQWINEERLRAVPESTTAQVVPTGPAVASSRGRERLWMTATGVAVFSLAGLAYWWYPRPAPPQQPITFTVQAPPGQTITIGPGLLALSPDGRRVAFTTGPQQSTQFWVRDLGSLDAKRLDKADGAWHPTWSPNGKSIAFVGSGGLSPLRKVDVATGMVTQLAPQGSSRPAWSKTGVILFEAGGKLLRVPDSGGVPATEVMAPDPSRQETGVSWPTFLPDGRRYLFIGHGTDTSKAALFLAALDTPGRTFLMNLNSTVEYSSGYLFYQREGTVYAHTFDADTGKLVGDEQALIDNVRYNAGNGRGAFSVSDSGTIVFVFGPDTSAQSDRTVTLLDRTGKSRKPILGPGKYENAVLSPDGRQAIVEEITTTAQPVIRALWLLDVERRVPTRFTTGKDDERNPVWSPDGSNVVFESQRDGKDGVYRRAAGGGATRDERLFVEDAGFVVPTGFSSDGKRLLITRGSAGKQRIWVLPLEGDMKPVEAFPGTTTVSRTGVFSPDDKWIAYGSGSGPLAPDTHVYLRPYPADDRLVKVSPLPGHDPKWSPNGLQIMYRSNDDAVQSVDLKPDGRTFRPMEPVTLFTARRASTNNFSFSVDKTLEKFLSVIRPDVAELEPTPPPLTVIVNWVASLKRPQ